MLILSLLIPKDNGPIEVGYPLLNKDTKDLIVNIEKGLIVDKFEDELHTVLLKEVPDSVHRRDIIISYTQEAVVNRIKDISNKFSIKPVWLMRVIIKESGGYPQAVNPYSNATGIIQWMPSTAKYLGTSVSKLKQMSIFEQLFYVEEYLNKVTHNYTIKSYEDLHLAVFYPAALGKLDSYVIGYGGKLVAQNKAVDYDDDGVITKRDFKRYISN